MNRDEMLNEVVEEVADDVVDDGEVGGEVEAEEWSGEAETHFRQGRVGDTRVRGKQMTKDGLVSAGRGPGAPRGRRQDPYVRTRRRLPLRVDVRLYDILEEIAQKENVALNYLCHDLLIQAVGAMELYVPTDRPGSSLDQPPEVINLKKLHRHMTQQTKTAVAHLLASVNEPDEDED